MSSAIDYVRYSCGIAGEDVANYVDELEKRTSADTDLIEQLTARVRELEAENVRLSDGAVCGDCDGSGWLENRVEGRYPCTCMTEAEPYQLLTEQLAAEQLNNKRLREALGAVIKVHGYESGIPVEAISTQASTEALDQYVAEKVKEAGKFDMWKTNPYTKVLETSIKQLTKQRDLAVEAMREALECGEDGDWQSARRILATAIKESEAK